MELFQSQSVVITGENRTETRRIVKVARRTGGAQAGKPFELSFVLEASE